VPEVALTASSLALPSPFRRFTLCIGLACLALAGGCNRPHQPDVVASVNGHPIAHLEVLRNLIDNEIQQQRAAKLNLVATDEEVEAKLAEIKAPYTQEEFNRQLNAKNMTLDDLKRQIRRGLTTEKLMNREINSKINITDADISAYYNANKSLFNLVEPEYHLAEIVVSAVPTPQPGNMQAARGNTDAEARKKIEALHTRLESGDDFGALASQFSEQSSTASSGGDMGRLNESQLRQDSAVFAAIAKLRPGQITDVMPLYDQNHKVNGYAIYKLLDKEAAGQYELNDPRVQQTIRGQLRESRAQLLRNAYDEMLRDQAHVENYYAEEIFRKGAQ
jgi:peptidyl-prolyl cis-trans isomerase SurA